MASATTTPLTTQITLATQSDDEQSTANEDTATATAGDHRQDDDQLLFAVDTNPMVLRAEDDEEEDEELSETDGEFEEDLFGTTDKELDNISDEALKQMTELFERNNFNKLEITGRRADVTDVLQKLCFLTFRDNKLSDTDPDINLKFTDSDQKFIFVNKENQSESDTEGVVEKDKEVQILRSSKKTKESQNKSNDRHNGYNNESQLIRRNNFRKMQSYTRRSNYGSAFRERNNKRSNFSSDGREVALKHEKDFKPNETKLFANDAKPLQSYHQQRRYVAPNPANDLLNGSDVTIIGETRAQPAAYQTAYGNRNSYLANNQTDHHNRYYQPFDWDTNLDVNPNANESSGRFGQRAQQFVSNPTRQQNYNLF